MKLIKRSGIEVDFDVGKIINAIGKANKEVPEVKQLTSLGIMLIADAVENECLNLPHSPSVDDVQNFVENELMKSKSYEVAKAYIKYRYEHDMQRNKNALDDTILSLVEYNNEEVKQENSNKNPEIIPTQRDYIAGTVSRDITRRKLLPKEITDAHDEGIIHFHDSDYFIQHLYNCCLVNLEDMLQNGTVISGTMIEKPHMFSTACNIATQCIAQISSSQYGFPII